ATLFHRPHKGEGDETSSSFRTSGSLHDVSHFAGAVDVFEPRFLSFLSAFGSAPGLAGTFIQSTAQTSAARFAELPPSAFPTSSLLPSLVAVIVPSSPTVSFSPFSPERSSPSNLYPGFTPLPTRLPSTPMVSIDVPPTEST